MGALPRATKCARVAPGQADLRSDPPVHRTRCGRGRAARTPPCSVCAGLRQLGLAYLAFPSAEHSRFTHALGALAIGDARARSAARAADPKLRGRARFANATPAAAREPARCTTSGTGRSATPCEAVLGVRHEERTRADPRAAGRSQRALERDGRSIRRRARARHRRRRAVSRCCARSSAARISTPTGWTICCATRISPASSTDATTSSS